jgi:hypothetical protein
VASGETFWADPAAKAAELAAEWTGRYVDVTDWGLDSGGAGPFGAAGVVEAARHEAGRVWLDLDWGYSLVVTPTAELVEVEPPDFSTSERLRMPPSD